ncbi:MAG: GspH/FimT family pseudopilin [Acidobacteriota bacterium]|nr:GspH/FimT family pseudopilin [Acidobacteriota bacterium]
MSRRSRGYTLVELLTTIAILGMTVSIAIPAFGNFGRRRALRAATAELRGAFALTRSRAIATGKNSALKFTQLAGVWHFAAYEDGDGDGVRNDDIAKGIDRMLEPPRVVLPESRIVSIGLLRQSIKDPDGDPLPPTKSPVAFNRTTLCSFSPLGESTPGTIYLTDRGRELWCVRVFGATAKLRVLRYDIAKKRWVQ